MRCIKHVIRYISIKQLWNHSKYVLNHQGCRWLTDWTKEQKTKEPVEGTEEPSPESREDRWFAARIWYMYLGWARVKNGSQAHKGESVNFKTSRRRDTALKWKAEKWMLTTTSLPPGLETHLQAPGIYRNLPLRSHSLSIPQTAGTGQEWENKRVTWYGGKDY